MARQVRRKDPPKTDCDPSQSIDRPQSGGSRTGLADLPRSLIAGIWEAFDALSPRRVRSTPALPHPPADGYDLACSSSTGSFCPR